jgi:hypothetical protein
MHGINSSHWTLTSAVSCSPVNCCYYLCHIYEYVSYNELYIESLPFRYLLGAEEINLSEFECKSNTYSMSLGSRIASVEKFLWHPMPFNSPGISFGWKLTWTPNSSAISLHGPTWYSYWAGITSAFNPLILIPGYKQAL